MTDAERWKRAVAYAFSLAERNVQRSKEPGALQEWVTYYLAQQWDYRYPPGGLFEHAVPDLNADTATIVVEPER